MPTSAPLPAIEASPRLGLWVREGRGSVLPTAGLIRSLTLQVRDPFPVQVAEDPCVGGGTHTSTHTPPPALHGPSPPQSRLILGGQEGGAAICISAWGLGWGKRWGLGVRGCPAGPGLGAPAASCLLPCASSNLPECLSVSEPGKATDPVSK